MPPIAGRLPGAGEICIDIRIPTEPVPHRNLMRSDLNDCVSSPNGYCEPGPVAGLFVVGGGLHATRWLPIGIRGNYLPKRANFVRADG